MELFLPETMPEEYRTEAVSLMVRISPLVNRDTVEQLFLPKFCELCSESMFHIRKVCATSIGEICRVVGPELSEQKLLPKFFNLCEDGIWGVRKACTECFMEVSNSLSPNARRSELAQLFVGLLCDQSRWVRMSAFQALGPFISTFANPTTTGLYYDEDGILRVQALADENIAIQTVKEIDTSMNEKAASTTAPTTPPVTPQLSTDDINGSRQQSGSLVEHQTEMAGDCVALQAMDVTADDPVNGQHIVANQIISSEEVRWKQYSENTELVYVAGELEQSKLVDDFGSFKYWRDPVPTLDIDGILNEVSHVESLYEVQASASPKISPSNDSQTVKMENEKSTTANLEALATSLQTGLTINTTSTEQSHSSTDQAQSFMFGPTSTPLSTGTMLPISAGQTYASVLARGALSPSRRHRNHSTESSNAESSASLSELMAKQQDIIPHLLLENYLSMTDPSRAQTVDSDIAQHCAYSLPAVAYTLGKENWKCLRSLYETLVADMQWKVRRTLAFSIHELAVILGPELTHSDLVPIFDGFIKDLDEVRVGVLTHLADFLKLLNEEARKLYLPKIEEFLETDNNRVWRTRLDLAMQLVKMCDLFSSSDVVEYIAPIAMRLLTDRVADVRHAALPLISSVLGLLKEPAEDQQRLMLINDLIERLALSEKWHARQTYAQACIHVLKDGSIKPEQFTKELLPSILTLSLDKIPNVRLAVSQLISQCLLHLDYFTSSKNPHHDDLMKVEMKLKADPDRDVRYFASLAPQTNLEHHETVDV